MEKLQEYFDEHGIMAKWFGEKCGMLSQEIDRYKRKTKVPVKYWKNVIIYSKGHITLRDLLEDWGCPYDEIVEAERKIREEKEEELKKLQGKLSS